MRESQYIAAIHKKLPPIIYRWKINDRFAGGVADAYYSSMKGDIWIEYKYQDKPFGKKYTPNLSSIQAQWLKNRQKEGRNVALVIGSSSGGFIVQNQDHWKKQYQVPTNLLLKQDIADWIISQVME